MSFWNDPQNNSIKVLIAIIVLAAVGAFAFYEKNESEQTTGRLVAPSMMGTTSVLPTTPPPGAAVADGQGCTHSVSGGGTVSGTTKGGKCCSAVGGTEYCYSDFDLKSSSVKTGSTVTGSMGDNPTPLGAAVADGTACTHHVSGGGTVSGSMSSGKCCATVNGTRYCWSDFDSGNKSYGTATNPNANTQMNTSSSAGMAK